MPVLSTAGAASLRAFGAFSTSTVASNFIVASGGTVTTSGNYRYHTFTSDANFVVTAAPQDKYIDFLIVGAGGGSPGGGGGGGGVIIRENQSISTGSYGIDVGIGYAYQSQYSYNLTGNDSNAFGLKAIGGGGGGVAGEYGGFPGLEGFPGGSGGGGAFVSGYFPRLTLNGGAGSQPTSAGGGYGNRGGDGTLAGAQGVWGGGGGAGGAGSGPNPGDGISGAPLINAIVAGGGWGSPLYTGFYNEAKWNQFDPNTRSYGFGGGFGPSGYVDPTQGVVIIRYLYQ